MSTTTAFTANINSTLGAALALLKQTGHPVADTAFARAMTTLDHPTYKIAFVGRFQVGKSTLINRAFLKSDALLSAGDGLPNTAIATELKYGAAPQLEVFSWGMDSESGPSSNQIEVSAKVIEKITAEDLARETASDDPFVRTELSRNIARVVLAWPSENLRRYTLLDTPGIDDPDELLLANTTYRLLPECDVAVLLVPASQLSKIETDFLRQKLFDQGFSRLLVLVSHRADTLPRSAEARARIVDTIRSQLAGIGRSQLPVQIFCYDEKVDGDILNTPEKIEAAVIRFADQQAGPARSEKVVNLARQELHRAATRLRAELAAAGKTAEERGRMLDKARKDRDALARRYDQIADSLVLRVRAARDIYIDSIKQGLHSVSEEYAAGFDATNMNNTDAYDAVTLHIKGAESFLQPRIQAVCEQGSDVFQGALKSAANDFTADARALLSATVVIGAPLDEAGWFTCMLTKLPGWLVTVTDYLVTNGPIPGGPVVSLGLRWLIGKLFKKSQIMPADILRKWMSSNAKQEIRQALITLQTQITQQILGNVQQLEEKIKGGFEQHMAAELLPLEQALKNPPAATYDVPAAQALLARIEQTEQQLPASS